MGDFVFVGEALALDLVNTAIVVRGKPHDLLATPANLATWWRRARAHYPDAGLAAGDAALRGEPALHVTWELRAALRAIFETVVAGEPVPAADLEVLNGVLRGGYETVAIEPGRPPQPLVASHDPGPRGALLPIARSAFDLLTGKDLARLHRCANDRCVLLFYDTTKSATRRWCSVGCMNRARSSRRYRARKSGHIGDAVDSRGAAARSTAR